MGAIISMVSGRFKASASKWKVLTVTQVTRIMGESSELRDQRDERRLDRDNTNRSVSTRREVSLRKDDPDQSPGSVASTEIVSLGDPNVPEPPSRRDEELAELRDTIGKYKKHTQELQKSLENMGAMYHREQDEKRYYKNEYNFVFNRTVRYYADVLGIKSNGMTKDQRASLSDTLVADAMASHNLRMEAKTKDIKLHNAQEQLRNLRAEMLSRVENIPTVLDEHLSKEFHSLIACVKVLSRSIRMSTYMDISEVLKPRGFLVDIPGCHWEPRAARKLYIEAWIWSVLVEEIFGSPLSIFGKLGCDLGQHWTKMFGDGHVGGWPYPSGSSETWRHVTTERLLELSGRDTFTKGLAELEKMMIKGDLGVASHVYNQRKNVVHVLGDQLSALSATADLMQIPKIVNKASCLALDMLISRSRVQITYSQVGIRFNEKYMSVHDADDENPDKGIVALVVRPGLTKWGDAHGRNFDESLSIVPCEVQLEADGVHGSESVDLMTG
jgi:hypothetical protein